MSFWFWLTTIYEVMWWCMPLGVAQTAAAFYAVSVIVLFLLLEALAPPDENTYVPRRRRGRSNRLILGRAGSCFGRIAECSVQFGHYVSVERAARLVPVVGQVDCGLVVSRSGDPPAVCHRWSRLATDS